MFKCFFINCEMGEGGGGIFFLDGEHYVLDGEVVVSKTTQKSSYIQALFLEMWWK